MSSLFILIFFLASTTFSYNLDDKYPIIYSDPTNKSSENQSSLFGYSVMLIPQFDKFESQLIIGAPKANHSELGKSVKEPGIIYQCNLSKKCQPVSPTSDSSPDIAVKQIGMYAKVIQDNGWFGMSLSAVHPTLLKICAPHTKIDLFKPFTNEYIETMQGMCYFYSRSAENSFLQIETESLTTYNFSSFHWYNPQHGFSQNVAVGIPTSTKLNIHEKNESILKNLLKNASMIIGNPTNQVSGSISIAQSGKRKTLEISNHGHEQSEFGYSVTSGNYFGSNETFFASGAPVWNFIGKVGIINSSSTDSAITMFLHGQTLGEYFGASLSTGDLNRDGFDDLIIGAPHYGDDVGKVYLYLGSRDRFLENVPVIEGSVVGGQFGYSLACGDVDRDGYFDLIVGAPWEESGVIYVYNGHSALDEEASLQTSQRISAGKISSRLRGFGFSISNLVDVDNNKFVDVAVGAHKSSHVVVLRGKPVEKTDMTFGAQPINETVKRVSPEFCLKNYKSSSDQVMKNYTITIVIDPKYKRFMYQYIIWDVPVTEKSLSQVFEYRYSSQTKKSRLTKANNWNGCIISHFNVKPNVLRLITDPVEITLSYELNSYQVKSTKNDSSTDGFCKLCPVKYRSRKAQQLKLTLPLVIECKNKSCNSDVSVTTSVYGVGKNYTWEIASGDITIEAKFQNHGQPAHGLLARFIFPKGVHLRSILSFCQEEISENSTFTITCQVGNPLYNGAQKTITLDLDMRYFQINNLTSLEDQKLLIDVIMIQNQGTKKISIPITLKNNVSSSIIGKTDEDSFYLTNAGEKTANITFQHVYNIFKHGATPITEGQVTIEVPISIDGGEPFIELEKPQLQISGAICDCEFSGIPIKSHSYITARKTSSFDKFNNSRNEKANSIFRKKKRNLNDITGNLEIMINSTQDIEKYAKNDIIFLNCSNARVQCGTVTCDLKSLRTSQDVGTVILNLKIKLKLLSDIFNVGSVLCFNTKAQANILRPLRNATEVQVFTTFYNMKEIYKPTQLYVWIILASVIIGLIILSIVTKVLHSMGFFQKKQKWKLNYSRVNVECTEKLSNEELAGNSATHSNISLSSG